MWRVDEVGGVPLGGALQTQLAVRGHGVVKEGDAVAELAVVQHPPVVLAQRLPRLRLELELVLVAGPEPVHGAHLVRVERLAEQVDGGHLAAEQAVLQQHNRNIYVGDYLSYGEDLYFAKSGNK